MMHLPAHSGLILLVFMATSVYAEDPPDLEQVVMDAATKANYGTMSTLNDLIEKLAYDTVFTVNVRTIEERPDLEVDVSQTLEYTMAAGGFQDAARKTLDGFVQFSSYFTYYYRNVSGRKIPGKKGITMPNTITQIIAQAWQLAEPRLRNFVQDTINDGLFSTKEKLKNIQQDVPRGKPSSVLNLKVPK